MQCNIWRSYSQLENNNSDVLSVVLHVCFYISPLHHLVTSSRMANGGQAEWTLNVMNAVTREGGNVGGSN